MNALKVTFCAAVSSLSLAACSTTDGWSPSQRNAAIGGAAGAALGAAVAKDGMEVSGDSIMGLLMLGASRGTTIDVTCSGDEAEKLADALEALVAARFGEDY